MEKGPDFKQQTSDYKGVTEGIKALKAGAFIIGPHDAIQRLKEEAQKALDSRWKEAQAKVDLWKAEIPKKLKEQGRDIQQLKLSKQEFTEFFIRDFDKEGTYRKIEFCEFLAIPFSVPPKDYKIAAEVQKRLDSLQQKLVPTEWLPKTVGVDIHPLVERSYNHFQTQIQKNHWDSLSYLVGIEPVSIPAFLQGWRQAGLCLFYGAGSGQDSSSFIQCALREIQEELAVDISKDLTAEEQMKRRQNPALNNLPLFWEDSEAPVRSRTYLYVPPVAPITHKYYDEDEDDFDFPDEYERLGEDQVQLETGFRKFIVVDNLPVVDAAKYEKLQQVITKIFSPGHTIVQVFMPKDDKGNTLGFAFIEFAAEKQAEDSIQKLNGYKLDRHHVLKVHSYEDFEKYDRLSNELAPSELPPYKPKDNLWWWLLDEQKRDQYVCRYDDSTEIYWNNRYSRKPASLYLKKEMTLTYVVWSPYGTYLGTFHRQGVILWGGPNWEKLKKFGHSGVKLMEFSPQENYLVTLSDVPNEDPKNPKSIVIWDVRSGVSQRSFPAVKDQQWPIFQWSHDEKYFARLTTDTISVYETSTMKLLGGKSFQIPSVKEFCWSPSNNIIAYWIPELNNNPARIILMEIPSRKILRSHNLFQVSDCKLHWQNKGDYLCAKVDRHTKSKKKVFSNFLLFRAREKDIPINVLDDIKESVVAFAWEPSGHRFGVVHVTGNRNSVSIYTMQGPTGLPQLVVTLDKRAANHLFWSPTGRIMVLAGMGSFGGALEFYDVDEKESMRNEQHAMMSSLEWDPSGRYVATAVSYWRHQLENGYTLWTFQGKEILHVSLERFYQFIWRPRPPSPLPAQRLQELQTNLKQYSQKFKDEDARFIKDLVEKRKQKKAEGRTAILSVWSKRKDDWEKDRERRRKLLGNVPLSDDEAEWEEVEEEVSELVSETEEVVD